MDNMYMDGSSPRVWGTQFQLGDEILHARFIPTRVGNTMMRFDVLPTSSVHPHACGEHNDIQISGAGAYGSSPRVWGTRVSVAH